MLSFYLAEYLQHKISLMAKNNINIMNPMISMPVKFQILHFAPKYMRSFFKEMCSSFVVDIQPAVEYSFIFSDDSLSKLVPEN